VEQRLRQDEHWFKLRLIGGYAAIALLFFIVGTCTLVLISERFYADRVLNAATLVLVTGLGGLILTIRKVIISTIVLEQPISQRTAPAKRSRSPEPGVSARTDEVAESITLETELSD
jgi:hypothetical protein